MSNQKVFDTKTLTNHDDCKEKIVKKNSLIRVAEEHLTIYWYSFIQSNQFGP